MINKNKIIFWDRTFKTMIMSFIISIGLLFVLPESYLDNNYFVYPWFIIFITGCVSEIIFRFGMTYYSFKLKKYGWMLSSALLGTIFSIIFYFSVFKKLKVEDEK